MDGYLDYYFIGTILCCIGGNIALKGSGRLLQIPSGRILWAVALFGLVVTPIVLFVRSLSWEVVAAAIMGAIIGAVGGRIIRNTRFEFLTSLASLVLGVILLVRAVLIQGVSI